MSDAMKRDNLLTAEIDRLRARVAELEAAGDALAELLGRMKPDRDQATADAMDALDGWRSVRGDAPTQPPAAGVSVPQKSTESPAGATRVEDDQ